MGGLLSKWDVERHRGERMQRVLRTAAAASPKDVAPAFPIRAWEFAKIDDSTRAVFSERSRFRDGRKPIRFAQDFASNKACPNRAFCQRRHLDPIVATEVVKFRMAMNSVVIAEVWFDQQWKGKGKGKGGSKGKGKGAPKKK